MSNIGPNRLPGRKRGARGIIARFLENPASMKYASGAIITVTVVMTLLGAVVIRVFDHEEFPTFGDAVWFTLQTVTTVGYGDNVPADVVGRVVAGVVMLTSVGLITVITAIITSTFVGAAAKRKDAADGQAGTESLVRLEAVLQALDERLERMESTIRHPEPTEEDD
jgi:voltage-gated potassium channel